ncbi:hypothetical protein CAF53_17325 [Sphingobium sp. LB126]|uniref:Uncharacterized protein n=2 Tax=Sphingobium chungbukense TaxID=56193 RepID=A0A0M3APE8_9SPHN|nr:hypothetical protein YP76_11845 [Sphingobium chungbukense]PJG45990.1 hypothetical protein CAF53_17325 [Sphingobium sp. LB126]
MLLRRRSMVRSLPFLAIRKPPAAMAMERDAKEEHPCGLRHVHSCGNWSIMAAILWWALRNRD